MEYINYVTMHFQSENELKKATQSNCVHQYLLSLKCMDNLNNVLHMTLDTLLYTIFTVVITTQKLWEGG